MNPSLVRSRVSKPLAVEAQDRVRVASDADTFRVVACQPISTGERILTLSGTLVTAPSRHTLQVGASLHMHAPAGSAVDSGDGPVWLFLNHSCSPNACIEGHDLVAISPIAAGEEVTFDYNTTEYEMASPFRCECGQCDGRLIRGFKFLSAAEQHALRPRLAAHLRRWLDGIRDC